MARHSLFVLKVLLDTIKLTKQLTLNCDRYQFTKLEVHKRRYGPMWNAGELIW